MVGKARTRAAREYIPAAVFLAVVVVAWEVLVRVTDMPNWLLPAPLRIVTALWQTRGQLISHAVPTIVESALGFVIGVVIGVATGVVFTRFALFRRAVYPLLMRSDSSDHGFGTASCSVVRIWVATQGAARCPGGVLPGGSQHSRRA